MYDFVSIVMPVYNVEAYLADALESVLNQTHKNIELICVDDGSSDNSLSILNFYSARDPRIKVIAKKNEGVSVARNTGIKACQGDYVCFLDSDDFMHPKNIEIQLIAIKQNNADIACCNFKSVPEQAKIDHMPALGSTVYTVSENPVSDFMYKKLIIDSSSCNKLYKKELVRENMFETGLSRGEDEIFILNLMTKIKRLVSTPQTLVYFRNRGGSLTKQSITASYLKDHYHSFVSMAKILENPEILKHSGLTAPQVKKYLAKKIYKRFVVHVLRKNKDRSLAAISREYIEKLINEEIFDYKLLPLSRRITFSMFRYGRQHCLTKLLCRI